MGVPTTPPPPTRIISWQQQVQEADPNWQRDRLRPVIYKFSNGRSFVNTPNPYTD